MTISQRELRVLDAIEGELTRDATLARLTRLFTGPVTVPADVWVHARRTAGQPAGKRLPAWLFFVLVLVVALVTGGLVLGVLLTG